jgi:general secretion pathway protein G
LPLNSDYDLFSIGADCRSASSLSSQFSLDDVIRANNGGYFGLGKDY